MRNQRDKWNASGANEPEDDLDRVLDTALARYADVKAREGLEQRLLANLRTEESAPQSKWLTWGLATAVLAMLIVGVAWQFGRHTRSPVANHPARQKTPVEYVAPRNTKDTIAQRTPPVRKHIAPRTAPSNTNPKLDQFPSPHPMSEQERILAMYINQDPEHAALIAEARMEALRQDEAERVRAISADDQGIKQ